MLPNQNRMGKLSLQEMARQIDAHFDALLYDGMPLEQALEIEAQRDRAHAKLTQKALQAASQ